MFYPSGILRTSLINDLIIIICLLSLSTVGLCAEKFDLVTQKTKVTLVYATDGDKLDSIAAHLLAADIQRVTGYRPAVLNNMAKATGNVIIIGSIRSKLMLSLKGHPEISTLDGKWECYHLQVLNHPAKNITRALVITGSDNRGTAYGVFDISERIGVSPWYWWADAIPKKRKQLTLTIGNFTSAPPSVKYRGLFINDEDWGLLPWSAKTLDPATGNIGPKTYAKVFELLLRLKANLIWPAMHPGTKAFYQYAENKNVAADYQIVIGSSHAEPMLRNNVSEWDKNTMGDFNYLTNQKKVYNYWEERVKESKNNNSIYSLGMRGIHDSGIEGIKSADEAIPLLKQIFSDQRGLLEKYINSDITAVPQAFTAYKEVLDIYDRGLRLPDDVTLAWPDDNYGYIQRLNNTEESKRKGGSGIYYHASYWGRPHDYLWLSSTSPALIREEMTKAYESKARNIWVLNVGDIKPAEYNIQLFMDMAYHIAPFEKSSYSKTHLNHWLGTAFGQNDAPLMSALLWENYRLAFERKPEFMGWSQTEPTTQVNLTAYSHANYGDQAQQRINAYLNLEKKVKALAMKVSAAHKNAFYELVYYPVVGASLMNQKFLYRDKAILYAQEGRLIAKDYAVKAKSAYQEIIKETASYNSLANGKWAYIMSANPRNLPVFQEPVFDLQVKKIVYSWQAIAEGAKLPAFSPWNKQKHFIDIFLCNDTIIDYSVKVSKAWIKVSQQQGKLLPAGEKSQDRIWVEIDWNKLPLTDQYGEITIKGPGRKITLPVNIEKPGAEDLLKGYNGFVENNGYISIYAQNYSGANNNNLNYWKVIDGLGSSGNAIEALPLSFSTALTDTLNAKDNASVSYDFYTLSQTPASFNFYTLPTHPLNKNFEMRYAIGIDDGPLTIVNFKTTGRSEEWKQNVLSNAAVRSVKMPSLNPGKHVLKIYMIDPGVILDRIVIDLGGLKPFYGIIPENRPHANTGNAQRQQYR